MYNKNTITLCFETKPRCKYSIIRLQAISRKAAQQQLSLQLSDTYVRSAYVSIFVHKNSLQSYSITRQQDGGCGTLVRYNGTGYNINTLVLSLSLY